MPPESELPPVVVAYLREQGRKGGRKGGKKEGKSKLRGDRNYYRRIGLMGARAKIRNAKKNFEQVVARYEAEHGKPNGRRPHG